MAKSQFENIAAVVVQDAGNGLTTQSATDKCPKILPNTKAMETFLSVGYAGMTVEKAGTIIRERESNPALWPYEKYEQAQAFLEAYSSSPIAIDTSPGFNQKPKVSA